jgi:hypothetical protein
MHQELDGHAAGIAKHIAHPLRQLQADSVAGVQIASGFGDPNDRATDRKFSGRVTK